MKLPAYQWASFVLLIMWSLIGWLAVPAPPLMIHPFIFAPEVELEVYNYISGLTAEIAPLFLLAIIVLTLILLTRVISSERKKERVKKYTNLLFVFTIASIVYQSKEVFDYIFFYNQPPKWLDDSWYLLWWEFFPYALIFAIAAWKSKLFNNGT